ncbi:GNAT family N-acetyltransferase [Corynebacterium auris]|uniref:GNAT family N-acetyltransferase n=1 Tax=Corynebacterium auris TaxID=44750 RepID=UPI0025B359E2|nr:GNAT family N-acetyltransferase [Corynebacterium auris]WJY67333.1 Aerobactin synthase [Corynebacterium auris]
MSVIHTTAGWLTFRPAAVADHDTLHRWVTDPRSRFWGALDASPKDVAVELARLAAAAHEAGYVIERAGTPLAFVELYDPSRVLLSHLAEKLPLRPGDLGMHLLCAPPEGEATESGLTSALMAATVAWIFAAPRKHRRIIVEPDTRNTKILAKNALAGFRTVPGFAQTVIAEKTACIQAVEPAEFYASPLAARARAPHLNLPSPATHLTAESARRAEAHLVAKALREMIHERVLTPLPAEEPGYATIDAGGTTIRFAATKHPLEHYSIDPDTVRDDNEAPVRLIPLVSRLAPQLGIPASFVHTYLEELSSTLAGRARAEALARPLVAELTDAAASLKPAAYMQYIESAMVEGHPGFIANAGRAGMSEAEATAYVPEQGRSTALVWVAVRREAATVASIRGVRMEDLTGAVLARHGLDPERYVALPVHPWQWENKVTTVFADLLLSGDMVYLEEGEDLMHPQQSLRTFFNLTRPELPYVKTAVAVRNMGFTRGLSPAYMSATPAINEWVASLLDADPDLTHYNVRLLKEIAAIGVTGDVYHGSAASGVADNGPHQKMLAALWRESPIPMLGEGNVAVTLAAVLHTDPAGRPLAAEWIDRSGLTPADWLARLLNVYLRPAIRALAEYDIAFMLHSENVILELDGFVPVGSFFKDIGEEVAVLNPQREVPEAIARITSDATMDQELRAQPIHADIIDGVLRHLGALLSDAGVLSDEEFWACVRACVNGYKADYPDSGATLPLCAPDFTHSCLNRLQWRNPETMVDLSEQNASLLYAGRIPNPLYRPPSV